MAAALRAWHEGGAAAGDLAFWRQHVEQFRSPKAYALVIETLLDHRDPVAAMALLVQWLGQAEEIPLVEEDYSFHDLALVWMEDLGRTSRPSDGGDGRRLATAPRVHRLSSVGRWRGSSSTTSKPTPRSIGKCRSFEMAAETLGDEQPPEDAERTAEADDEDDLFGAAYEHVTYRDSTDDGVEGEMFETGESATDFELVGEAERIVDRLNFLTTVAQLWKTGRHGVRARRRRRPRRGAGRLARSGGRQLPAVAGPAGLGAPLSHSAAARHARVAGGVRPPAERQGNAAGGDHRGVRRDGRCRADDPRLDGPSAGRGRGRPVGAAGRRRCWRPCCAATWPACAARGPSCCDCSTSSRCCTWPWAGAATRSGSSPRAASSTCCAAC